MSIVIDTAALLRPPFTEAGFSATQWDKPADKAVFANGICRFIAADFPRNLFTKKLYHRLSMCWGHIAHYNQESFYEHFFLDVDGKVAFLDETLNWSPCGDPAYTYSDVERAVQKRLHDCDLLNAYRALREAEIDRAERALLAALKQKFEGAERLAPIEAPVLHPGTRPSGQRPAPRDQPSLF